MTDQQDTAKPGFFARLKAGLSKSAGALENVTGIFTNRKLDAESVAELEDALVRVDLGAGLSHRVAHAIAQGRYDQNIAPYDLRILLSKEIGRILKPSEKPFAVDRAKQPFVVLVARRQRHGQNDHHRQDREPPEKRRAQDRHGRG